MRKSILLICKKEKRSRCPEAPAVPVKKKIESAARGAGATYAKWDMDSKILIVTYDLQYASSEKIQKRIAGAGFDTPLVKADPKAYRQLDSCCRGADTSTR